MNRVARGPQGPARAVIYVRQSRDAQGTAEAVARQAKACQEIAQARGWQVVAVVEDNDTSASSGKVRPGWVRVLRMIEQGEVEYVVGWHVDRLLRSMGDLEHLIALCEKYGVAVVTASGDLDLSTDAGRLVGRILGAVARGEVERKAARQVLQNEQRVSKGKPRWAHRPFGYSKDGTPLEPEATALREAYEVILRGERVYQTRDRWNAAGLLTHWGNEWTTQAVSKLLRDPRNYGAIRYRGEIVGKGSWEPLVSEELWSAVQTRLGHKASGGHATASDALLVTVARCAVCEGRVWVNRTTQSEPGYTCGKGHLGLPVEWADARVLLEVTTALGDPEWRAAWVQWVKSRRGEDQERTRQQDLLTERLESLGADYGNQLITRAQLLAATGAIRAKLKVLGDLPTGPVDGWVFDPEFVYQEFEGMSIAERREWLRSVTSAVRLHRRGKGSKRGLQPDLVEVRMRTIV